MDTDRPRVAFLVPASQQTRMFSEDALAHLDGIAEVRRGEGDTAALAEQIPLLLHDAQACVTGWGSPPLTDKHLEEAPHLRLIVHAAGSVKRLVPPSVFARGIAVCHAANIIADAVAEMTILLMLLSLRRVHEMDRALKAGQAWRDAASVGDRRLLASRTVGLVGAGYVGRKVARLVSAFGPRVLVFDPYLSSEQASVLGVEKRELRDLFAESEIVSVHAPTTPETRHLVGAPELHLLRDGAIFINTARSWVVDQGALLAELQTGRFWAALDVFDQEPLPVESPFRQLENVFLTPHQAGLTIDTQHRQGRAMVEEVERFFMGQELRYRISPEAFALMA